ncbi:hypothetical protein VCHC64A1_01691B, partial [Vibrio cholerae HC-64A1]
YILVIADLKVVLS